MFYTIYKTTNIINGKYYIGKHQTKDLNDGYLGSGMLLKKAINKYGIDNFHKEILHICKDEKHMNLMEKILVVPDPELNYNLCPGGHGGFGYLNSEYWTEEKRTEHNRKVSPFLNKEWMKNNKEMIIKASQLGGQASKIKIQNMSIAERKKAFANNAFRGKKHTDEWKQNHSSVMKEKQKGQLNSQYGTCWITNGIENKKIKKEELDSWIELGYNKGRTQYANNKEKQMSKDCGCGRSPTGKCIGWHGLTNEQYSAKLQEYEKKQLTESAPQLLRD